MRKRSLLSLCAIALASATHAVAEDSATNSSVGSSQTASTAEVRPFTLFGSIGSGYGRVWGNEYAQAPGGAHVLLSALGAYQLAHWEFDSGLSWLYSSVSGQAGPSVAVRVRTRAGTFDLGARYRLGSRWQIGPALNMAFGTDTRFGPAVGQSQGTLLLGVKAIYELPKMPFPFRLWSQISTDTTFDRHFAVGLVGVQLGFPIRLPRAGFTTIVKNDRPVDVIHSSAAAPVPPVPLSSAAHQVKIVLDAQRVFFGTMSSGLRPEMQSALAHVGRYLKEMPEQGSAIRVEGHADRRGRFELNLKLSKNRAESVRQAMVEGGADTRHFEVSAFSYLKPLDDHNNRVAWAKNRRVEITFENVKDPAGLRKELAPLEAAAAPLEAQ